MYRRPGHQRVAEKPQLYQDIQRHPNVLGDLRVLA
jgi:hypothetical protein